MTTKKKNVDQQQSGDAVSLTISAPNFLTVPLRIRGTAPYVQHKFSAKALKVMRDKQAIGDVAKKNRKKEPKDFGADYQGALHVAREGWYGIPAAGLRAAMISACRACGFAMTRAKLSVFVEADGFDATSQDPLVRISRGEPTPHEALVKIQQTTDIRVRPMWAPGWEAVVRIRFDGDQFTATDVANLLLRAGQQVGIGEGRPDSRSSCGQGWGLFELVTGEVAE